MMRFQEVRVRIIIWYKERLGGLKRAKVSLIAW